MTIMHGWKITDLEGKTYNGFQWPLPTDGVPITVTATNPNPENFEECPKYEGDGLCVIRKGEGVRHATSGGISLSECIGLVLSWVDTSELIKPSHSHHKLRVREVTVHRTFSPLAMIRQGLLTNLYGANLYGADLRDANLYGAIGYERTT